MWGGRRAEAGEVVFASGMCAKAPKVQICPKTIVQDCSFVKKGMFPEWSACYGIFSDHVIQRNPL